MDILLFVGKVFLTVFAFSNVAFVFYVKKDALSFAWLIWKRVRIGMILKCCVGIIASMTSYLLLTNLIPLTSIGWAHIFIKDGGNIILSPITTEINSPNLFIRVVIQVFLALFLVAIPFFTHLEEQVFRKGYHDWRSIMWQSIKFGFAHMIVGVPVAAAVILSGVGLFYAYEYKNAYDKMEGNPPLLDREGEAVLVSTTYHTITNSVLVGYLFIMTLRVF